MKDPNAAAIEAAQTPEDRIVAGAAYLSTFVPGLWVLCPLVIYYWKGRSSRFIGFHAVQALLLDVALVPAVGAILLLMVVIGNALAQRGPSMQVYVNVVTVSMFFAAFALPFISLIWMGVRVMRGHAGVLPVLGRLARGIIGDGQRGGT